MAELSTGRIDPRALLRSSVKDGHVGGLAPQGVKAMKRTVAISLAAVVGLGAFGTMVVRANDDNGVLAFVRQNAVERRAAQPVYRQAAPAYPVSYYAPRAFFPSAQPQRRAERQRSGTIVASYAPFGGFIPVEGEAAARKARNQAQTRIRVPSVAKTTLSIPSRLESGIGVGGRITYCVRTCDGFFFPLNSSNGSDKADEAACNRLCPTSQTKLYVGEVGRDIDDARSRENGRRYAAMSGAFSYRKAVDKSCSCNASGMGLTIDSSAVYRDASLRVGDVVMTSRGMRVFTGGAMPYRDSNFASLNASSRFSGETREKLRTLEQASLPGRSGVSPQRVQARKKTDELKELRQASESASGDSQLVRYVGPNRSVVR